MTTALQGVKPPKSFDHLLIPLVEALPGPDRMIHKGRFAGQHCYYKTALLNTLIALKPRVCLEIGTHMGGSTDVFKYYFEHYRPDGRLATVDIKKYVELEDERVRQVIVYPHVANIAEHHMVSADDMLADFSSHIDDSSSANIEIIRRTLLSFGAETFDFCFLDGDHQMMSFIRDMQIAASLLSPPFRILIDDTKEELHECAAVYQARIKTMLKSYDFEDWPVFIGCSLVWKAG